MLHQFSFDWTDESLKQLESIKKKKSKQNLKYLIRLSKILDSMKSNPFKGIGKPEPLQYNYPSCWSRRITRKDRKIYQVEGENIIIISILGHYN